MSSDKTKDKPKLIDFGLISSKLNKILQLPETDMEQIASDLISLLDKEIIDSETISEKYRKPLRDNYVSLRENLKFYKKALEAERRGEPSSYDRLRDTSFDLQRSIMEARIQITTLVKDKETQKATKTQRGGKTETGLSKPATEDKIILTNLLKRIEDNRDDDLAYNELGNYYFSLGRYKEARNEYTIALSKEKSYVYFLNIGDSYKMEGNWQMAKDNYEKAMQINNMDPRIFEKLGGIHFSQGDFDVAIDYGIKSMKLEAQPDYLSYVNVASAYNAKRDYEMAKRFFENAITLNSGCEQAHFGLAYAYISIYDREGKDKSLIDKAIEHYKKVLNLNPKSSTPYGGLGDSYSRLQEWNTAIEYYLKALSFDASDHLSHSGLAGCYSAQGKLDKAFDHLNKAIQLKPDSALYLSRMGNYYRDIDEYDKAIEFYDKSLIHEPNDDSVINHKGRCYYRKKDYEKALNFFKKAIDINPNEAMYHDNVGMVNYQLSEWEEMRKNFEKALELDPKDDLALAGLGNYNLDGLLLLNQALTYFQEASAIVPEDPYYISRMADVYSKLGDWDNAIKYAIEANKIDKSHSSENSTYESKVGDVYHNKGVFLYNKGLYNEAINEYMHANDVKEDASTYQMIYLSYLALGNYSKAKHYLTKAIELDSSNSEEYVSALNDLNSKLKGGEKKESDKKEEMSKENQEEETEQNQK